MACRIEQGKALDSLRATDHASEVPEDSYLSQKKAMSQPQEFIALQAAERQPLLSKLHEAILANDASVSPVVEGMMGKEMIVYKFKGTMKYALSSVAKYMSLHLMPIYMNPVLHAKYMAQLPAAKFQKGCINFENEAQVPIEIVAQLIRDCAPFDLAKIREEYQRSKKK